MRIPLPARKQPFRLKAGVRAHEPLDLLVRISDAQMPNTYYINRRVPFDERLYARNAEGYRVIELPMPMAPEHGWLELIDPETGDNSRFTLESLQAVPLEPTAVWGHASQLDFAEFAQDFAERAGYLRPGFYDSPNHQYLIEYVPVIRDELGHEQPTPARISRKTGRIQASQQHFLRYTVPMRLFILLHERFHWEVPTRHEKVADFEGLRVYLDLGYPGTEALYALTRILIENPNRLSRDRVAQVNRMVRYYNHRNRLFTHRSSSEGETNHHNHHQHGMGKKEENTVKLEPVEI